MMYECPADRPVTWSEGKNTLADCITCVERDGSNKPVFDDLVGDCVSCDAYSSSTPIWNGTKCVSCAAANVSTPVWTGLSCTSCYIANANTPYWDSTTFTCTKCPNGKIWDVQELACKETIPKVTTCAASEGCVYKITHNDITLYLVESVSNSTFSSVSPKSATEETTVFLTKYGIVNVAADDIYPDHWAGAIKYCENQGLRLPTMNELLIIMNALYGTTKTCSQKCNSLDWEWEFCGDETTSATATCCGYSSLTVANQALYNFLATNSSKQNNTETFYLWSGEEGSDTCGFNRVFDITSSGYWNYYRNGVKPRALCIKK